VSKRRFPKQPVLGVGAVVFKDDSVLLVKRGNPPLAGTWSLPGGAVHRSETLEDAVVREVKEECGIDIDVIDLIREFEYIEPAADGKVEYHYLVFDFKAVYKSGELRSSSDADDARWIRIGELALYELTAPVSAVIEEAAEKSGIHYFS
jgi:8-oxo-dGTP diphosphatase